jgi:FkbM family methyltransferase
MCSVTEKLLFQRYPRLYRLLYSVYKTITDKGERHLYKSFIKPGMVVVDIGANIGIYTSFFAKLVGQSGEVHAFEPEPANFHLLNRSLSPYKNVYLNQSAVADRTGNIFLYISSSLNVDHRTYDCGEDREKISIQSIALDDYFPKGKCIDFIKMDIQGFEYQALIGMERVLRESGQAKIVLEYFPVGLETAGSNGYKLKAFLIDHGFSLYSILKNGELVSLNKREPSTGALGYTNIFAMRNFKG